MELDVGAHLGAVERSVASLERDGQQVRAVTLARSLSATVEDLWGALTNPSRIESWFLPISGDLQQGGRYQLEGNAGGVITACQRPTALAITWEFGGDVSWVEVDVSRDCNDRARLTLTHTMLLSDHWDEYGPGATGVGWELSLLALAMHLTQPDEPMPDEAAFATSPDGRAFITGSSEGWERAAIASGTDPAAARAACARTTAFYTGETPEPD